MERSPKSSFQRTDFARSSLPAWKPPVVITSERRALEILKHAWKTRSTSSPDDDHESGKRILVADLDDFEIYRAQTDSRHGRSFELTGLQYANAKKLSADGFLCLGSAKVYVEGLSVEYCSVEGYQQNESPNVTIYVQSQLANKDTNYDIWFRINKPSQNYRRFHEPFLCIAQLAKHVLDYLEETSQGSVGLGHFKIDFHQWLVERYPGDTSLQDWHAQFLNRSDFRVDVNAYIDFLYQEAYNLQNSEELLSHPLWGECMARGLTAVPKQDEFMKHTITTPDVYESFKDMYFGKKLRSMPMSNSVQKLQRRRKIELGFLDDSAVLARKQPECQAYGSFQIQVGDVVAFDPDRKDTKTWKNSKGDWLAYVQDTRTLRDGAQRLFVLYMYRPHDTSISNAKYRFENELFFSDNCNCTEGELLSTDIKGKYDISWLPQKIDSTTGYFVRQTYMTQESSFVTMRDEHKTCICRKIKAIPIKSYRTGDTVYITKTVSSRKTLEPVVIRSVSDTYDHATVRKLLRLDRDCTQLAWEAGRSGEFAANELVLTDDYEQVQVSKIQRRCHIRFISKHKLLQKDIPFPYDRRGAGDFWFISMGLATLNDDPCLVYLSKLPEFFSEAGNFPGLPRAEKLPGISFFCGGGNFDRGLEEGGAVEFRYAIDLDAHAIHTQRANAKDGSNLQLYFGSVDDYLRAALAGVKHELIARVGELAFIAAGSPCPGFSTLQQNYLNEASLRNASHITTLCSTVDLYRPKYALLENVVSMAHTRTGLEDQNVLSQLIACLVSLGYQVSQFIMDSWNYGSGQHRSRVFVAIVAPGLVPIIQPFHTHSRPIAEVSGRSLGKLPNGEQFGQRELYPTPFPYVTAGAITSDLPDIGNGVIQTCISHPDHRVSNPPGRVYRALLECIPHNPPGCGYKEAYHLGLIPSSLQKPGKEHGKAFQRVKELGLVPTITTNLSMQDSRNGANLHWSQNRSLTILDARRAQGYLDDEPIIGSLVEQYRIVGNGVDRMVAFANGLALRQALLSSTALTQDQGTIMNVDEEDDYLADVMSDFIGIPALDGPSDTQDTTPAACAAITRGVMDLCLRSPAVHVIIPAHSKRSREGDTAHLEYDVTACNAEEIKVNKRAKIGEVDQKSAPQTDVIKIEANPLLKDKKAITNMRSTRHSGLEVIFEPKQWNWRPEREHAPKK